MDFGIFIRPGHYTWQHTRAVLQAAEAAGFRFAWFGDSHLIWHEVSPYLTLAAMQSEKLHIGAGDQPGDAASYGHCQSDGDAQ